MSPERWTVRLEHILESIANIRSFTEGMSFDAFAADKKSVRAVAYEFAVIGEAARNVPAEVQQRHPEIPWGEMQGMRNVVIHQYNRVNVKVLWDTLTHDLPPLVPLLRDILECER